MQHKMPSQAQTYTSPCRTERPAWRDRNCEHFLQGMSRVQALGGRPTRWGYGGALEPTGLSWKGGGAAPSLPRVLGLPWGTEGDCWLLSLVPRGRSLSSQGRHVSPSARNLSQWALQTVARSTSYLAFTEAALFLDHVIGLWV